MITITQGGIGIGGQVQSPSRLSSRPNCQDDHADHICGLPTSQQSAEHPKTQQFE